MKKENYESPKFETNELQMFDGIAETCWGYGHVTITVYKDVDNNKKFDLGTDEEYLCKQYYISDSGHCNEVSKQVQNDLNNVAPDIRQYLTAVSSGTNSKSLNDSPFQDFRKS